MRASTSSHARALPPFWTWVGALTLAGLVLRVLTAREALFADELSTAWIVLQHSLSGVVSTVHTDAEITPPLYFVLAKLTTQLGSGPIPMRLPSLVAGTLLIPVVAALGLRTVGRVGALVACALVALAPFCVYYGAEARAYALLMLLATSSTLALLLALDDGRRRWWVLYAVCVCGTMYSHYTGAFVLAAQVVWALVVHPAARRPLLVATGAAAVGFVPWLSGLYNDLTSPTSLILDQLSPIDPDAVRIVLEHWTVGYPYQRLSLRAVPGIPALLVLLVALVVGAVGATAAVRARRRPSSRLVLVLVLAAATFVGEMAVSLVGNNLLGVRNLAASWPALALSVGALVAAAPARARPVAVGLTAAATAIAVVTFVQPSHGRPAYAQAARWVEARAQPGDVVMDGVVFFSPGPVSGLDLVLRPGLPIVRVGAPAERDHPFNIFDRPVTSRQAIARALQLGGGRPIFLVSTEFPDTPGYAQRIAAVKEGQGTPPGYRIGAQRTWPSALGDVFAREYVPLR